MRLDDAAGLASLAVGMLRANSYGFLITVGSGGPHHAAADGLDQGRVSYHEPSARDAHRRIAAFFNRHLTG